MKLLNKTNNYSHTRIGAIPTLIFRPKRSTSVNGKCKEPEEISLGKYTFLPNGTLSKVIAQNADETRLSYCQDFTCSQNNVYRSHTDLILARPNESNLLSNTK
ncbi:unnamed protein product [Hymenolepis diminuta]|uniref:Uncharacterized protein n=1 Tax=Hymenolepis diminuta TaxID=6216 RepID=A0A564Y0B8_HYMDI|nr:unnamed protein product [Hymenolepis diminuta]